ncbi:hypothetical protein MJO28_012987 [Puccinia striiformis f. sp. tritici]|uniref:Uncharacterized protein n=1 Tax=Puccinia striiformis f. sp. tritici TaxID=168172 RepID=A0ACC0DYW3_9BASI|nr:hypothetical protein MJO28_012987 [Puccinia striiformis f. sp. tritici]
MSSAASSPTPQRPERYLPTYNTTTVISQPGLERWSPESDENGTILHFCAHNRGEQRLQELRRVMYQGLPIGGPRRRPPTRGPIPPPSLVLTQRIPTPTNVFDTNEEERSSETAGRPSPDPNEASVNSTHVSAGTTLNELPPDLVACFGLEESDFVLVNQIISVSNIVSIYPSTLARLIKVFSEPTQTSLALDCSDHGSSLRAVAPERAPDSEPEWRGFRPFSFPVPMQTDLFHLQEFIVASLQTAFLRGDLEYYSHATYTGPARLSVTPLTVVLTHIRQQFRAGLIDHTDIPMRYGQAKVYAMSRARNQALQGADNPHGPLALRPTTLQDQLRLAHGRLNMLQHQFSPIPTSLSNWEEFDHEIQLVKAKSAHYQEAYANAILSRDAELFDGINTLSMIPEAERRMPTYDEVMNQLQFIVHTELDNILGSDG